MEVKLLVCVVVALAVTGSNAQLDVCGQAPLNTNTRIVGGHDAAVGAWPWQVSLQFLDLHLCGGSLINNQWILTAAHCIISLTTSSLKVVLGRDSLQTTSPNEVISTVSRLVSHPNFNPNTFDNDVALVQLSSPVKFTNYIKPVCLAADGSIFNSGSNCWITGWGYIKTDTELPTPQRLQQASIPIVSNKECHDLYGIITDNMMCTGTSSGGAGTCIGDGGGPLVRKSNTTWVQGGVVSFLSAGGCALPNIPSGYARVSKYESWIKSQITTNQPGFIYSGAAQPPSSSAAVRLTAPLLLTVSLLLSSLFVLS